MNGIKNAVNGPKQGFDPESLIFLPSNKQNIHLVQSRKNLTMQDTILMYVADPFCFVSKYGSDLLDKVRKHRKYKALMQRLERLTALSADDIAAIYSYDYNFGIHPVFTGDEFLF